MDRPNRKEVGIVDDGVAIMETVAPGGRTQHVRRERERFIAPLDAHAEHPPDRLDPPVELEFAKQRPSPEVLQADQYRPADGVVMLAAHQRDRVIVGKALGGFVHDGGSSSACLRRLLSEVRKAERRAKPSGVREKAPSRGSANIARIVTSSVVAKQRTLMSADAIDRAIARMAHQIVEPDDAQSGLLLIGIRRGGETLARRLTEKIVEITGTAPGLGFLNINLYRDDDVARELPESEIRHEITGRTVVIVDDVLFTGRTVRSALDAVTDLGRPKAIRLAVLVDRGLRELPVQADYVGKLVPTSRREHVRVTLGANRSATDVVTLTEEDRGPA